MKQYAFDVKRAATVRIEAESLDEARGRLEAEDCLALATSASIDDCAGPHLFEVCDMATDKIYWDDGMEEEYEE